jgi:hypothetical protein
MKKQDYQCHSERHFSQGDWVFLHLQPYKKTSLKVVHSQKIAPKFDSPYKILKGIGLVA